MSKYKVAFVGSTKGDLHTCIGLLKDKIRNLDCMEQEVSIKKLHEPDSSYCGLYSYADYLKWTIEERLELIKGRIFTMSPAPSVNHQRLSQFLNNQLYNFLTGKSCEVFAAPFDVRLPKKSRKNKDIYTVVQPDLCVICDPSKIDALGCIGAPDIVVEILSPSNSRKELKNKYEVYEESGVKEYWIISPQDHMFLMYTLTDGKFVPSRLLTEGDVVTSAVLPGFVLDLEALFGSLPKEQK